MFDWGFIDLFFVILSLCVLFLTPDNCFPCSQRCARVLKIGTNKSRILGLVSDNWRDISRPSIMLSSWGASKLITTAVVHAIVCVVYLETATEAFPRVRRRLRGESGVPGNCRRGENGVSRNYSILSHGCSRLLDRMTAILRS